jgi:hypothetical protein
MMDMGHGGVGDAGSLCVGKMSAIELKGPHLEAGSWSALGRSVPLEPIFGHFESSACTGPGGFSKFPTELVGYSLPGTYQDYRQILTK